MASALFPITPDGRGQAMPPGEAAGRMKSPRRNQLT